MQIDPISAIARRNAAEVLAELREEQRRRSFELLEKSNILMRLGEAVQLQEVERAKNRELFEEFRQRSARHR